MHSENNTFIKNDSSLNEKNNTNLNSEFNDTNNSEKSDSLYKEDEKDDTEYRKVEKIFKIEFNPTRKRSKQMVKIPLNSEKKSCLVQFPENSSESLNGDFELIDHMAQISSEYYETITGSKLREDESMWDNWKLQHPSKWRVYYSKSIGEGFYFIKNVFTPDQEYYWSKRCLNDYPQNPNKTNLDLHHGGYLQESIWSLLHKQNYKQNITLNNSTQNVENNDKENNTPNIVSLSNLDQKKLTAQLNKMTWCTLGYQYEWTSRKYIRSLFAPFPEDASTLCTKIANIVGVEEYTPEAAIVNFYHENMRMGGHKDESEETMSKPIVSVSFGSSAIYLLGGDTRNVKPLPILIESGDVMILGGIARTWYHGIARILEDSCPSYWDPKLYKNDPERESICKFLHSSNRRINMNVRQVYDEFMD